MTDVLITNARIFDATGAEPFNGEVLIDGNRITEVRRGSGGAVSASAGKAGQTIDAAGAFLMPGMTEAHTHFSWNDQPSLAAIAMMPPEEHVLWSIKLAKRYLDMGWTSCVGAAAAKPRLDVVVRDAIKKGDFPGPRCMAASRASMPARATAPARRRHGGWSKAMLRRSRKTTIPTRARRARPRGLATFWISTRSD